MLRLPPPVPRAEGKSNKMVLQEEASKQLIPVTFITPSNQAEFQICSEKGKAILDSNHHAGRRKRPNMKNLSFWCAKQMKRPFRLTWRNPSLGSSNGLSLILSPPPPSRLPFLQDWDLKPGFSCGLTRPGSSWGGGHNVGRGVNL